jgi:hypothetical protein
VSQRGHFACWLRDAVHGWFRARGPLHLHSTPGHALAYEEERTRCLASPFPPIVFTCMGEEKEVMGVHKAISNNLDESGIIDTAGSLWLASSSPATFWERTSSRCVRAPREHVDRACGNGGGDRSAQEPWLVGSLPLWRWIKFPRSSRNRKSEAGAHGRKEKGRRRPSCCEALNAASAGCGLWPFRWQMHEYVLLPCLCRLGTARTSPRGTGPPLAPNRSVVVVATCKLGLTWRASLSTFFHFFQMISS